MDNISPLLTIITTSYSIDRLKDILCLLDSIEKQTFHNLETIMVIEGDLDLYNEILSYSDREMTLKPIVIFNNSKLGASSARNLGIENAQGEIIAIVDDDVELLPDWAEEMLKTYQDESVIGVTGPALPHWENDSMSWFPDEFSWLWGGTLWNEWGEGTTEVSNVGGMNCSFRREAFEKAGGYLTSLKTLQEGGWFQPTGEEVEFSLRVRRVTKQRIVFNPRVRVYHKVQRNQFRPNVIAKRSFRMGYLRNMAKHTNSDRKARESVKKTEFALLKRVLTRLLPDIMQSFLRQPIIAWRRLCISVTAILFAALGYLFYYLKPFNAWGEEKPGIH